MLAQTLAYVDYPADAEARRLARRQLLARLKQSCQRLSGRRFVSLSHKDNLLVGLLANRPCGVDLETTETRHPAFLGFVLKSSERAIINDATAAWTIKEACFKVHNDGYEPADFQLVSRLGLRFYRVVSGRYTYHVRLSQRQNYLTACAFVHHLPGRDIVNFMEEQVRLILEQNFSVPSGTDSGEDLRQYLTDSIDVGELVAILNQNLGLELAVADFRAIYTLAGILGLIKSRT